MRETWNKLPTWGQWIAGTVAGITALVSVYAWGSEAVDKAVVTETELGVILKSMQVQQDQQELMRLNRDLIAERYANEAEKEFILEEMKRLQKELLCNTQEKCEEH